MAARTPPPFDDGRGSVDDDGGDGDGHDAAIASDTAAYSSGLEHRSRSSRRSRTHSGNDLDSTRRPAVIIRDVNNPSSSNVPPLQNPSISPPQIIFTGNG